MRGNAGCFHKGQHWEGKWKWGHRTHMKVGRGGRGIRTVRTKQHMSKQYYNAKHISILGS